MEQHVSLVRMIPLRRLIHRGLAVVVAAALARPATAEDTAAPRLGETIDQAMCRLIESSAAAQKLPVPFLTRLIWRESSFRAGVVSPKGAQGIAQFMPATAAERGLADPFDP